jgi:uncharacterized protein YbjQ (UPF0145 family)
MPSLPGVDFITTTSNAIDGYDVTQTFGVVRGIIVRSRSVLGRLGAKIQTFFGGDISILTDLCERARADAFAAAIDHCRAMGGNAMIAVRYDATEIMDGVTEVLCYGTAVRVAPRLRRGDATT